MGKWRKPEDSHLIPEGTLGFQDRPGASAGSASVALQAGLSPTTRALGRRPKPSALAATLRAVRPGAS